MMNNLSTLRRDHRLQPIGTASSSSNCRYASYHPSSQDVVRMGGWWTLIYIPGIILYTVPGTYWYLVYAGTYQGFTTTDTGER